MSGQPWYTFNRIDAFGTIDPQGNYYKPDSNILTPAGYPVTALLPGTVTSVQRTGWGQSVVTVKLDKPLNSLATHTFYEHMHNANVFVGQRVQPGDLIGSTNQRGEGAALGFGLYNGDVYGSGPGWALLQKDLGPGGAGLLNPTKLLDSAKGGKLTTDSNGGGTSSSGGLLDFSGWGQKIGLFLIALLVIAFGAYILLQKQVNQAVGKAAKTAAEAAIA